jgi:hypothetical protein
MSLQTDLGAAAAPNPVRDSRWLLLACFMSGAAGLIFEMVWFHRSSLVFGSSVWATSLVLSSFMGGLTVGAAIVGRAGHRIRGFSRPMPQWSLSSVHPVWRSRTGFPD